MGMTPTKLKRIMNLWPPYLAAGIKVLDIAEDWTSADVRLSVRKLNANYFGTAFGGSLSAMSDPFYTLLATNQMGSDYLVWDTAGEIEFVAPGKGQVFGRYELPSDVVAQMKAEAANGEKHLRWFETELTHADGTVVARVRRQVYVRLKKR